MQPYNFGATKQKPIKVQKVKIDKFYMTKVGDRTLTPAKKRQLKEAVGFKCQRCNKKVHPRLLEIHHKKSVASHKNKMGFDLPVYSIGKRYIPKYDRHKSNLEVVCVFCHDKTKKKPKKKKSSIYGGF